MAARHGHRLGPRDTRPRLRRRPAPRSPSDPAGHRGPALPHLRPTALCERLVGRSEVPTQRDTPTQRVRTALENFALPWAWRSAQAFRPSAPRSVRTARALRSHCSGAVRRGPSHCAGAVRKHGAQCDFRSAKMGVSAKKSVRSAKENSAQCAQNSAHCAVRSAKNRDAVRRDVRARGATPAAHTISPRQKHRHECARERREASRPWWLIWWICSRQSPWAALPNGGGRTFARTSSRCC